MLVYIHTTTIFTWKRIILLRLKYHWALNFVSLFCTLQGLDKVKSER